MRTLTRRSRCLFVVPCLMAIPLPVGCGPSRVPAGGQMNVTIPKEEAIKQNSAFQNYSKGAKKGKPPG